MESYQQKRAHALQLANRRRTGGKLSFLAHWARIIVVSLALFVVIRAFGVEAFKIASGSIEHTLFEGDFLLINKLVYGAGIPGSGRKLPAIHSPRRGDVIVFTYPVDPRLNYVKRIVGIPSWDKRTLSRSTYRRSLATIEATGAEKIARIPLRLVRGSPA